MLGEEFGVTGGGGRRWIVDPIDGTRNYSRGIPVWATLIALEEDGESASASSRRPHSAAAGGPSAARAPSRTAIASASRRRRTSRTPCSVRARAGAAGARPPLLASTSLRRLLGAHARRRGSRRRRHRRGRRQALGSRRDAADRRGGRRALQRPRRRREGRRRHGDLVERAPPRGLLDESSTARLSAAARLSGASVTLSSPCGASGSRPFARASAEREQLAGDDREERRQERRLRPAAPAARSGCPRSRPPRCRSRRASRPSRWMRAAASCTVGQRLVVRGDRPDGEERVERGDRAVREVGRRQRLGGDAAGLEQLQRDLARRRELDAAADHEHPPDVTRTASASAAARALERRAARPRAARRYARIPSASCRPAAGDVAGEQGERRERVQVGLRRRDRAARRPAPSGSIASAAAASSESGSFVIATVNAPAPARARDVLDDVRRAARLRERRSRSSRERSSGVP